MAIQCLSNFAQNTYERKQVLERANDLDISAMEAGASAKVMHNMRSKCFTKKMQRLLEIIHVNIDCKKLVPMIHAVSKSAGKKKKALQDKINKYWESVEAEYCHGRKSDIFETELTNYISELMDKKKVIFLNLCLMKYFVDLEEEDNYSEHGTSAILIPNRGKYKLYYVNSHGNDLMDIESYETIGKTKRSLKKHKFDKPIDVLIMHEFVKHMSKCWEQTIEFEDNTKHVYYGVNMQAGDGIGSCYIFPWVVYYNLGKYYDKKRTIDICGKKKVLESISSLIMKGELEKAIQNMFIDFDMEYTKMYMLEEPVSDSDDDEEEYMLKLEKLIGNAGDDFVLKIVNSVVKFMEQDIFSKLIN